MLGKTIETRSKSILIIHVLAAAPNGILKTSATYIYIYIYTPLGNRSKYVQNLQD